ncbi:MAG: hypothetical protein ACI4EW_07920 [Butyrivibrio sp.]
MKDTIKSFLEVWKADYNFKTFATSAISSIIGIAFTIYNGFLGIYYSSVWNGSICVYYILLAVVRGTIVVYQKKTYGLLDGLGNRTKKIYCLTHIVMFLMNVSLIIPIAVMIRGDRVYNLGMIPAISMAAYTTYRIVMAIIHYSKSRRINNALVKELRTADLVDTLVAVLTLQNTMIIASAGEITSKMKTLSIVSSSAIWIGIVILSVFSFVHSLRSED